MSMDEACQEVARVPLAPGPESTTVALPPAVSDDPPALYRVQVRLLNANGRFAEPSPTFSFAGGKVPPPVARIQAAVVHGVIQLTWAPLPPGEALPGTVVEVRRLDLDPTHASGHSAGGASLAGRTAKHASGAPRETDERRPGVEVLRATGADAGSSPEQPDRGGVTDPTARPGGTYRYTVQRVRIVELEGKTFELASAESPAATITNRSTEPPEPPGGLVLVPTAGSPGHPPTIDLSWDLNTFAPGSKQISSQEIEPQVAGYNVYRREGGAGPFVRLNTAPVGGTAYSDAHVTPGIRYTYRVTAVDRDGNESKPGKEAEELLRSRR